MFKFKLHFSGKSGMTFLGIEIIFLIGGFVYLTILTDNFGFVVAALVLSLVVATILIYLGLFLINITRLKVVYFILPAIMAYPVISAWINMLHEDDLLQVLVDFFFLSPLLVGMALSLPAYIAVKNRNNIKKNLKQQENVDK